MLLLGVCLTFCGLLTLSRAGPVNSTSASRSAGRCDYMKHYDKYKPGEYIPECDQNGNFLPRQCCTYTGYCWCVNIYTGDMIYNTKALLGDFYYECGEEYYCPHDWSQYGEKCFMFVNHQKTWAEAESYCLFEGGNLASVHSYKENYFILGLTKQETYNFPETWLGGNDAVQNLLTLNFNKMFSPCTDPQPDGPSTKCYSSPCVMLNSDTTCSTMMLQPCLWFWSDGTKFDYDNFYTDYYMERSEHCLMMNYGPGKKWHFASCNETLPFVCEKSNWKKKMF